jgi:signal peptidase I
MIITSKIAGTVSLTVLALFITSILIIPQIMNASPANMSQESVERSKLSPSASITNTSSDLTNYSKIKENYLESIKSQTTTFTPGECNPLEALRYENEGNMYKIKSGSMSPTFEDGYLVGVGKFNFNDLRLGDIIAFHRPTGEDVIIISRVMELQTGPQNETVITTKEDANPASIPGTDFPIREYNYIGRVQCFLRNS